MYKHSQWARESEQKLLYSLVLRAPICEVRHPSSCLCSNDYLFIHSGTVSTGEIVSHIRTSHSSVVRALSCSGKIQIHIPAPHQAEGGIELGSPISQASALTTGLKLIRDTSPSPPHKKWFWPKLFGECMSNSQTISVCQKCNTYIKRNTQSEKLILEKSGSYSSGKFLSGLRPTPKEFKGGRRS